MVEDDSHDERDRDADSEGRRDARSGPGSIVHLGINVGIQPLSKLLGGILDASGSPRPDRDEWQRVDETASADRGASSIRGMSETDESIDVADEFLVGTHRTEDEFVVTAELPGVDEEDLSVGIDVSSNDLVISVDGRTIDRIPLPWSSTDAAKVWFNNGVLEVRLGPAGTDESEDGEDDEQ